MKMEGRGGGCCVTRYATGAYDMSKVERIMLRYRPIAPKPLAAGAAISDGSSSESSDAFSRSAGGAKRRSPKDNSNRNNRRRRKIAAPSPPSPQPPSVTLPLLPETPDPKDPPAPAMKGEAAPAWPNFENLGGSSKAVDLPAAAGAVVVTVECVTDTWREKKDAGRLGSTDEEEAMRLNLSGDTCPGFISDGYGRVTWTNGAFRGMVGYGEVWLVTKVVVGVPYSGGFTCRVRVQREKGTDLTVPCDVWRVMDGGGGFAWRLDVKAALTLGLAL